MPYTAKFDPARIFAVLHQHDVNFVVIGGLAAAAGGAIWTTFDADIIVDRSEKNLAALLSALERLHTHTYVTVRAIGSGLGSAKRIASGSAKRIAL